MSTQWTPLPPDGSLASATHPSIAHTTPASSAPALNTEAPGYYISLLGGLRRGTGRVKELIHFGTFLAVLPNGDRDTALSWRTDLAELRRDAAGRVDGTRVVGARRMGLWLDDQKAMRYGLGALVEVAEDVVVVIVEVVDGPGFSRALSVREERKEEEKKKKKKEEDKKGEEDGLPRRNPYKGTRPALGFQ
ncbi:hypothetical protein BJX64DRAFT_283170 [Aspergillus heterothallicus]